VARIKPGSNVSYQALSLLSRLAYEKFGEDAIPIIRDVWYEMGLASGERLKEKLSDYSFESAAGIIHKDIQQSGLLDLYEMSEKECHFRTNPETKCDVGIDNTSQSICDAVMSINQGQYRAICGKDVEMHITKSCAAGDGCCEVSYHMKDTSRS